MRRSLGRGWAQAQGTLDFTSPRGSPVLARSYEEAGSSETLMEQAVLASTVTQAISRVKRNRGSAGLDGMTVDDLDEFWLQHGERICQVLLAGDYVPRPVRRVVIPKPGGGERLLGIPTVVDRVVQQMLQIVLEPIFEPHFSDSSYGFRPARSCHDAIRSAQSIVETGRPWVVDIDLEKFFDTVNHDVLMSRLARRISDKRVLKLVRRFLSSGVMENGVVVQSQDGTPQGGPLSPLLANVLLDDLDKFMESRGFRFARYADDCNIYVSSQRVGERVMATVTRFLEVKLRLRVNVAKSAVAPIAERRFLGFHPERGPWMVEGENIAKGH